MVLTLSQNHSICCYRHWGRGNRSLIWLETLPCWNRWVSYILTLPVSHSSTACVPFVISAGYIRLRIVILKDVVNKRAHEESAQVACEAAGSIKTVASLTREDDCLQVYSKSLEGPLRISNRSSLISTAWFALSQSMVFYVIALVSIPCMFNLLSLTHFGRFSGTVQD